jgi:flagellar biosynthetic protein FliR
VNELFAALTQLTGLGTDMLWTGFYVFLRVGAMMALLPAFGEIAVPQRIKLVLALSFTAIVAPAVAADVAPYRGLLALPMATEVAAGLILGIGLRLLVWALQIAGAIAAQATSLSQLFATAGAEPQAAISQLFVITGLALAVAAGLHVKAAELLILSYDILPAGRMPNGTDLAEWGVARVAHAFSLGFVLAAPFTIAALVYNLALGVINRAMPQLMVSFVGAPALTLGGLVLLAVAGPTALAVWLGAFDTFFRSPFGILR